MNKLRKRRLVDGLMDAYVSWREACLRVSDAYAAWSSERGVCGTVAFGTYMMALDREEEAAEVYAAMVRRISEIVTGEQPRSVESGRPRRRAAGR